MTFAPNNSIAAFLPQTTVLPRDENELLIRLTNIINDIAYKVNAREIGTFQQVELPTGQSWDTPNVNIKTQTFRKVFTFGAIVAGATLNIAHGITGVTSYTHIYGTAITAIPDNRPIPYADVANVTNQILLNVTGVNIVITNGATAPNIASGIIVLEYLKN